MFLFVNEITIIHFALLHNVVVNFRKPILFFYYQGWSN